jgi:hypothetical protein
MPEMPATERPDYVRPDLKATWPTLHLLDRLVDGTPAMHAHADEYVHQWADEEKALYDFRKTCATVFGGLERVLAASIGMVFGKPPKLDWRGNTTLEAQWDNIDGTGTKGHVFAKRFGELCLKHGYACLLVDYARAPEGVVVTEANEADLGLRARWAMYPRTALRSADVGLVDGKTQFTMLLFGEMGTVPSGRFGVEEKQRYRVLWLANERDTAGVMRRVARWELFEEEVSSTGEKEFRSLGTGVYRDRTGAAFDVLPVAFGYTGRVASPLHADPPLSGVGYANLAHWRKATDIEFYEALCAFPQPTVIGRLAPSGLTLSDGNPVPPTLKVGPGVAVHLEAESEYKITELSGTALEQLKSSLQEKVQQMAAMGLSFLVRDTRAAETAEGKRLDQTADHATIGTAAQGIEDALNMAHEFHARYEGIPRAQAPTIALTRDFSAVKLDAATVQALAAMVRERMPVRLALQVLQAGGMIPADANLDRLELDWIANQSAADDAAAVARDATNGAV